MSRRMSWSPTDAMATGAMAPCPICGEAGGFHSSAHREIEVPVHLTWKPGEPAPWQRQQ